MSKKSMLVFRNLTTLHGTYFLLKALWSHVNDRVLNIKTVPHTFSTASINPNDFQFDGEDTLRSKNEDYYDYQSPDYVNVRYLLNRINLRRDDVVYDIGAGMGRILCLCARHSVKRCVGIELSKPLSKIARQNATWLRGRKAPIDIICQDAAIADLSAGTVFFFFNPFGEKTLKDVVDNIKFSLARYPRAVRIVYYNDLHKQVLEGCEWLEMYDRIWNRPGKRTSFWRST